jgi:molybdenum cofactor guanylyltransferase
MGRDKALLVVDGAPMVRRVAVAAREAGAATVITVGGDERGLRDALAGLDVRVVPDRYPGEGPLGALLTALGEIDEDVVLVVSCDLLAPDPRTMAATVAALAVGAGDVAVPEVEGRRQWLHAAWRRSARVREGLAATFAGGERSVHRAVAQAGLTVLGVADVAPGAVADADTPDDLVGGT